MLLVDTDVCDNAKYIMVLCLSASTKSDRSLGTKSHASMLIISLVHIQLN